MKGIDKLVYGLLGLVVLFNLLAVLIPDVGTAGDTLNSSGAPLGSLFVTGGIVSLIIMAGVLTKVFKSVRSN